MRSVTTVQETATYFPADQESIGRLQKQIGLNIQTTPILFLILYIQSFAVFLSRGWGLPF
jgi:hypothetical protein